MELAWQLQANALTSGHQVGAALSRSVRDPVRLSCEGSISFPPREPHGADMGSAAERCSSRREGPSSAVIIRPSNHELT